MESIRSCRTAFWGAFHPSSFVQPNNQSFPFFLFFPMSCACSSLASASTVSFPHGFRAPATANPLYLRLLSSPIAHPNPRPSSLALTLPRRLFLPSASAIWDALTGGNRASDASLAVRRGMLLFRQVSWPSSLPSLVDSLSLSLLECMSSLKKFNDG